PQDVREKLSTLLWYHMQAMRTLAIGSGRSDFDISEVKDEVAAHLLAFQGSKQLDNLSIAFTLFNREKKIAVSGHFGPSRPLVLCQDNHVTPENRVVMTLENGRDIRYWSVQASMQG